ncbi:TPA: site-specific DNA-methyltransferase [Streptococcus suis]|nr:site-specific DNA-methyltransferase [Streptococcus suis]HEM6007119.1 site-specific DNA-methyltransferase [Streptococcus suis]HEM6028927.1 site-specific DNA-methyltransferase [Streptococcus suis]HEM6351660.1 site-specific DNA-methyltransferase [Streptococcus suis]HEM6373408.1 site-specific DNA-methyltransferase [Streptococcus suis]
MVEGRESYEFTWVGKRGAIAEAGKPTTQTLRPDLEESVDFDKSENVFITGDNLEVLKVLQESYLGKIDMIYIDPPYNTGKDFVYRDRSQLSEKELEELSKQRNENDELLFKFEKNAKQSAKYHSDWLNMMYPRLVLARNLLKDSGVIFISIDDNEQANLKAICDEIFGEENFVNNIIWQSRTSISNDYEVSTNHNHTLIFSKNRTSLIFSGDEIDSSDYINPDNDPRGPWKLVPLDANHAGGDTVYPIKNPKTGVEYYPPNGRIWAYNRVKMAEMLSDKRIKFGLNDNSSPKRKLFYNERMAKGDKKTPSSIMLNAGTTKTGTTEIMGLFDQKKVFDYPKPVEFIKRLIQYGAPEGGLILDFFAGSGTTAHAVMQFVTDKKVSANYIVVQLDEDLDKSIQESDNTSKVAIKAAISMLDILNKKHEISELTKERIRRAAKKIQEEHPETVGKQDFGFRAYKLDSSNFKDVSQTPDSFSQESLFDSVSNIKDGRTDLDLLFQIMLTLGMELSLPIAKTQIDGTNVYNVEDGSLIACFADEISESVIRQIAKEEPLRAVFKDESFANSAAKINLGQIFKEVAPNTKVKVV